MSLRSHSHTEVHQGGITIMISMSATKRQDGMGNDQQKEHKGTVPQENTKAGSDTRQINYYASMNDATDDVKGTLPNHWGF